MGHLKEVEAKDYLSAGRGKSQRCFGPASPVNQTNTSLIEPGPSRANRPTFAEDFMLEHSHFERSITLLGTTGSYGIAPKESQPPTQYYGFPS
jgi:hypothetical protein